MVYALCALKLVDKDVTIDTVYQPFKEINKTSYVIYVGSYPLVKITDLDVCTSRQYRGVYIANIDYMKFELYMDSVLGNKTATAAVVYLSNIQYQYYKENKITELDRSIFGRFPSLCTGPLKDNVKHTVFKRMIDMAEERKKIRVIKPKGDTITITGVKGKSIRIFPSTPTSIGCKNKINSECLYPCYWNKKMSKCYDQPTGIYRPGTEEMEKMDLDSDGVYDLSTGEEGYGDIGYTNVAE